MRSSYSGSVIGPKMSTCTLPRMFMPAPWTTRTLGIVSSVRPEWHQEPQSCAEFERGCHDAARPPWRSGAASLRAHVHGRLAGREGWTPDQVLVGAARLVVADQLL